MQPHPTPFTPADTPGRRARASPVRLLVAALAAAGLLLVGSSGASGPAITVMFDDDDLGFSVASSKDVSNLLVELCDGSLHKHDGLTGNFHDHREEQPIVGVWVKSGNNGDGSDDPSSTGERFDNEGVPCAPGTSTSSASTSTSATATPSQSESETATPTATQTGTPTSTETETEAPTATETETETRTATETETETRTATEGSETPTATETESDTPTQSASGSATPQVPEEPAPTDGPGTTGSTGSPTASVPFFKSAGALVLGVGGALVGALLILRRRL